MLESGKLTVAVSPAAAVKAQNGDPLRRQVASQQGELPMTSASILGSSDNHDNARLRRERGSMQNADELVPGAGKTYRKLAG